MKWDLATQKTDPQHDRVEQRDAWLDSAILNSDWVELVIELQTFEHETADLSVHNRINAIAALI